MGRFGLCTDDALVNALRDTFGANIVRVPERRIQPLCTVAVRGREAAFRGALQPLLVGSAPLEIPDYARATSPMASLTGRKSKSVTIDIGLDILDQFLAGFGLPGAGIRAKFDGATEVAFSFQGVRRDWVDDNWLGRALSGRALDPQLAASRIFLNKPRWTLLLIDSTIASTDFTISVTKSRADSFSLDVPTIQNLVGSASARVSVESAGSREVTFRGPDALTFAFTTVRIHVGDDGTLLSLPPGRDFVLLADSVPEAVPTYGLDHVQVSPRPEMIEWDEVA